MSSTARASRIMHWNPSGPTLAVRTLVLLNFLLLLLAMPPLHVFVHDLLRAWGIEDGLQYWFAGSSIAASVLLIVESMRLYVRTRRACSAGLPLPSIGDLWVDLLVVAVWIFAMTVVWFHGLANSHFS